jgi:ABC-type Na+ efflux pump permease subunit
MDFKNSIRIMKKDWKTTIKKKEILLTMIFLPIVFTIAVPIMILIGVLIDPSAMLAEYPGADLLVKYLNIPSSYNQYLTAAMLMIKLMILPFLLFIPSMIPAIVAADSFAGEKERKTMESIALLPVSKTELILGKVLVSLIPSLLITIACFIGMGVIINLFLFEHLEGNILVLTDHTFLLTVFLMSPLLAFFDIIITTIISSRSKDLKSAQSISGALIVPVLAIMFAQMFNPAFLSPTMIFILSGILGMLCLIFIYIANKALDIEKLVLML